MGQWIFSGLCVVALISLVGVETAGAQGYYSYPTGYNSPFAYGGTSESNQKKPILGMGEGGLQLGPLRISPGVSISETYTSNPRMQNSGQQSDFLTSISPTFGVTLGQGLKFKDYVSFGYSGNLGAYTKITGNDYTSHTLWADVNLMNRPTTYMKLREAITYTNNPYGNQQFIGQGVANSRMINETDFTVGRNLPQDYSVELGYQNLWQNYFQNTYQSQSSLTNTANPTLLYELSGKTKLLAQYSFQYWNYYQQPSEFAPNYFVNQLLAGFRWAATARLSGEVKGGYAWQQYTNRTDLVGIPYQNQSAPIYSLALQYMVSPKTSVGFQGLRQYYFGGNFNGLTTNPNSPIINPNSPINNPNPLIINSNNLQAGYLANTIELSLTTNPRKDMSVAVFLDYELDQYGNNSIYPNRNDSFSGAGVSFSHQLRRYLSWGLTYTYQNRNSQLPGNSYVVNMLSANLSLSY